MQLDELIEVVEKQKECVGCLGANSSYACKFCNNYVSLSLEKLREMYNDILNILNAGREEHKNG